METGKYRTKEQSECQVTLKYSRGETECYYNIYHKTHTECCIFHTKEVAVLQVVYCTLHFLYKLTNSKFSIKKKFYFLSTFVWCFHCVILYSNYVLALPLIITIHGQPECYKYLLTLYETYTYVVLLNSLICPHKVRV